MYKKHLLSLVFLSINFLINAQQPNLVYAKSTGGTAADRGQTMTQDNQGNIYVVGDFIGTVDFDPGPGVLNLTPQAFKSQFIQKFNPNGDLIWAKSLDVNAGIISISIDPTNNIYMAGYFNQSGDFDPGSGTVTLTSIGNSDIFVLKLDANGDFQWVKQIGDPSNNDCNTVVTDLNGNVYLTGRFGGVVDFDPNSGVHELTSQGGADGYILKLDSGGQFQWVSQIKGLGTSMFTNQSLVVDSLANTYLTGSFFTTADMDPGSQNAIFTSNGGRDVFILKLDVNGALIWAKQIGGMGTDHSHSIFIDSNQNVHIAGSYSGTVDFDPGSGIELLPPAGATGGSFILKLDASGNYIWARGFESSPSNIFVDASENVFATGAFNGSSDFDPGPGIFELTANNFNWDAFVLKLDNNGDFVWAGPIGGDGIVIGQDLLVSPDGSIYTCGYFEQTCDFDPNLGQDTLSSHGDTDCFFVKWNEQITSNLLVDLKDQLSVFPNPSNSHVNILFKTEFPDFEISVWNSTGLLISKVFHSNQQTLQLELPSLSGLYFIELKDDLKNNIIIKVVKR